MICLSPFFLLLYFVLFVGVVVYIVQFLDPFLQLQNKTKQKKIIVFKMKNEKSIEKKIFCVCSLECDFNFNLFVNE
jgi:hypothetical protein